jgi:hypothetical protein
MGLNILGIIREFLAPCFAPTLETENLATYPNLTIQPEPRYLQKFSLMDMAHLTKTTLY